MRYFDTFTGIGGFSLAIENAYEETKNSGMGRDGQKVHTVPRGQETLYGAGMGDKQDERLRDEPDQSTATCVGFSEIDKYASSIYQKHYPNHKNYGDITKINAEELPDFELLVGGFPCQAFSVAGKRGGFEDTRGTLFFELARILRAKRPRLFVFENVKGLLSHDGGSTFSTIIKTLAELGYDLQWQIVNSKDFGVPQNRERVFIVGHLGGTPRPKVFPIVGNGEEDGVGINRIAHMRGFRRYNQTFDETGSVEALDTSGGGVDQPCIVSKTVRSGGRSSPHGSKQNWDSYDFDGKIRRLTPTECERLQAFPDGWTKYGHDGKDISDTQRYKCLGNAVTVSVVREIMRRIMK